MWVDHHGDKALMVKETAAVRKFFEPNCPLPFMFPGHQKARLFRSTSLTQRSMLEVKSGAAVL